MKYPSGKTVTKQDRAEALERLREWLKDGDTLWFILRHRAASGMQRIYCVKQFEGHLDKQDRVQTEQGLNVREDYISIRASDLTWNIASACEFGWNESHGGIKINGCGFSGEQEITDTVGRKLGIRLRYETL